MFSPLLRPLPHGALGPWDEIINLIPIAVGGLLLLYLYRAHRRRQAALPPEAEPDPTLAPAPGPSVDPATRPPDNPLTHWRTAIHMPTITPYLHRPAEHLATFIEQYRQAHPAAKLFAAEFYTSHPGLDGGRNLLAAFNAAGQVLGFMPLFPAPAAPESAATDPHHIWTVLLAQPGLPGGEIEAVRGQLLAAGLERATALAAAWPPDRRVRLAADMMVSQQPDIDFLLRQGFERYDGVYVMQRRAGLPIAPAAAPAGLAVRPWRMPTLADQQAYLAAVNACFADLPRSPETLQFFLESPLWAAGTALTAFDAQGCIAGSVLAYVDPGTQSAVLDDVFVLPAWRRQGLGQALVAAALAHLQAQGHTQPCLEVKQTNTPAVELYRTMGFDVINEEVLLGRWLA